MTLSKSIDKLNFLKLRNSALLKILLRELQGKLQTWKKYLQIAYLIKDLYPGYIFFKLSKLYNKKTPTQFLKMDKTFEQKLPYKNV